LSRVPAMVLVYVMELSFINNLDLCVCACVRACAPKDRIRVNAEWEGQRCDLRPVLSFAASNASLTVSKMKFPLPPLK
jgi:hypothetical protein